MPGVGYRVASAQQLNGQFPLCNLFDEHKTPFSQGYASVRLLKAVALENRIPSSSSRIRRITNDRLAAEITKTMLVNGSNIVAVDSTTITKDDGTKALLKDREHRRVGSQGGKEIQKPAKKTKVARKASAGKLMDSQNHRERRICFAKCFPRLNRRVRMTTTIRVEPSHVDSLSSAFAGRLKSQMLLRSTAPDISCHHEQLSFMPTDIGRLFVDSCITDNNIAGQVVKLQSRHFTVGTASVRIGECNFFNLSPTYQKQMDLEPSKDPDSRSRHPHTFRTLRIEVGADGRPRFLLTFWGELQALIESKCRLGWISNVDITEIMRKSAVAEQSAHILGLTVKTEASLGELRNTQHINRSNAPKYSRKLQPRMSLRLSLLKENRCRALQQSKQKSSLQQEQMLSLISQLRHYHTSILIFSSDTEPANKAFRLRFVSSNLFEQTEDLAHNLSPMSRQALTKLGQVLSGTEDTTTQILWGKDARLMTLYCVPVMGYRQGAIIALPKWWICYMIDAVENGLWN
jgi:hypothetical protein